MNGVLTYQECFNQYPNQWVLLKVYERDSGNKGLVKGKVIDTSYSKQEIIDRSRLFKKDGVDIAIVCTIETLEEAVAFLAYENRLVQKDYVSPEEYAFIFNLFYGLS